MGVGVYVDVSRCWLVGVDVCVGVGGCVDGYGQVLVGGCGCRCGCGWVCGWLWVGMNTHPH